MTSIEWLIMQLPVSIRVEFYEKNIYLQAKEMHKQEIITGYHIGYSDAIQSNPKQYDPEQYYQKTFKKD